MHKRKKQQNNFVSYKSKFPKIKTSVTILIKTWLKRKWTMCTLFLPLTYTFILQKTENSSTRFQDKSIAHRTQCTTACFLPRLGQQMERDPRLQTESLHPYLPNRTQLPQQVPLVFFLVYVSNCFYHYMKWQIKKKHIWF